MARAGIRTSGGFVGRMRELRLAHQLLEAAAARRHAALVFSGEPGIGKTRLLREIAATAQEEGFDVLVGCGSELEREIPFALAIDAFDDLLGSLDPAVLNRLGQDRKAELGAVFPAMTGTGGWLTRALDVERYRCHYAIQAVLREVSRTRPLLITLDDLHWADGPSLELISFLIRHGQPGILLAMAFRHEPPRVLATAIERAARDEELHTVTLGPLSVAEAEELLGKDPGGLPLDSLHAETGGNPFYLEQLAKAAHRQREWLLPFNQDRASTTDWEVPAAIRAATIEELRQLSPTAQRLGWAAAVAGEALDAGFVASVAELDQSLASEALDELIAAEIIRMSGTPTRLSFRHPILRRAVYDAAGDAWRLAAHQRAARILAERGAPIGVQAHHVLESAVRGDQAAVALLTEAGATASSRAPASAARWYEGALNLLPEGASREQRLGLMMSLANALGTVGRLADARSVLADAMTLVPADDAGAQSKLAASIARIENGMGHGERARRLLDDALRRADPDGLDAGHLTLELAENHMMMRDWDAAARVAADAWERAVKLDDRPLRFTAEACRLHVESYRAAVTPAELATSLDEIRGAIDDVPDEELVTFLEALLHLCYVEMIFERWDATIRHATRGLRLSRTAGNGALFVEFVNMTGAARMLQGRLVDAREALEQAVEAAVLLDNQQAIAMTEANRCWVGLLQGQTRLSLTAGQNAVEAAERAPAARYPWFARLCYAEALFEAGRWDDARIHLSAAGGADLAGAPPAVRPHWLRVTVQSAIAAGLTEEADVAARTAETLAGHREFPMRAGEALYGRACVSNAVGDVNGALRAARSAAEHFQAAGTPVFEGQARLFLKHLSIGVADTAGAEKALRRAFALFDACGADRLANLAARELRLLGLRVGRTRRRHEAGTDGADGVDALSDREREIAELVAQGFTNRAIAAELYVSIKTVERHLTHMFAKLGVSGRAGLASAIERSYAASARPSPHRAGRRHIAW